MPATAPPRHASSRLVDDASLPQPDRTEYGPDTVTFYWDEPKAAVIVDLDDVVPREGIHDPVRS